MREPHDVIVTPVVTEKASRAIEGENTYAFIVNRDSNKHEIARAVEALWDVKVESVRTMRYAGKLRRAFLGRMSKNRELGRKPGFKKALVKLAQGDTIELYEAG